MTASMQSLRCHAQLEPGIRLLQQRVGALGGRTLRGCEGHPPDGDSGLQPRYVRVAAAGERGHGEVLAKLKEIAAQANSTAGPIPRVSVEVNECELPTDSGQPNRAVDIVFAPQPGLDPRDYFEHLATSYSDFCGGLPGSIGGDPTTSGLLSTARQFYDRALAWHCTEPAISVEGQGISAKTLHVHALNFALWHHEDAVRRAGVSDREIARRKRCIDDLNARRNAAVEHIDVSLLERLDARDTAPLHTETPGTIVDRLSVLALRIMHTNRAEGPSSRLAVLEEQYDDLFGGLEQFLTRLADGEIRFKLYRQFKAAGQRSHCALFENREP